MNSNDLISREVMLDEFRSLCGPYTGDGWDNMGVRSLIMRQKTVDAVPLAWLEKQMRECDDNDDIEGAAAISWIIQTWREEQEARST